MNPEMPLPAFSVQWYFFLKKLQWKTTIVNTNQKAARAVSVHLNASPVISAIASATDYNLLLLLRNSLQKNTKTACAVNACWTSITSKYFLKKNLVPARID